MPRLLCPPHRPPHRAYLAHVLHLLAAERGQQHARGAVELVRQAVGLAARRRHRAQHAPHVLLHVAAAAQPDDPLEQRPPAGRQASKQEQRQLAGCIPPERMLRPSLLRTSTASLPHAPLGPLLASSAHLTPVSSGDSGRRGPRGACSSPPATMPCQPPLSHSACMPARWEAPTTPTTLRPRPLQMDQREFGQGVGKAGPPPVRDCWHGTTYKHTHRHAPGCPAQRRQGPPPAPLQAGGVQRAQHDRVPLPQQHAFGGARGHAAAEKKLL